MNTISLIECIVTWQGESADCGRRMLLCRFKYCNRVCHFCDTLTKMRVQQEAQFSLGQLQKILNDEKCSLMISGGEPGFENQFAQTLLMLNSLIYPLANVETNGLRLSEFIKEVDPSKNIKFIYSPKFFSNTELEQELINFKRVYKDPRVYIKLVYEDNGLCNQFLDNIVFRYKMDPIRIYLMPQGKTKEDLYKNAGIVFDAAEKYKVNFSSRTHLIYDFI